MFVLLSMFLNEVPNLESPIFASFWLALLASLDLSDWLYVRTLN